MTDDRYIHMAEMLGSGDGQCYFPKNLKVTRWTRYTRGCVCLFFIFNGRERQQGVIHGPCHVFTVSDDAFREYLGTPTLYDIPRAIRMLRFLDENSDEIQQTVVRQGCTHYNFE